MTVGSMLVGQIGTTLGFGTWGYLKIVFDQLGDGLSMFSLILVRIVLFVIATALYVLGMLDRLKDIADIAFDFVGQALSSEKLPKRIIIKRNKICPKL